MYMEYSFEQRNDICKSCLTPIVIAERSVHIKRAEQFRQTDERFMPMQYRDKILFVASDDEALRITEPPIDEL